MYQNLLIPIVILLLCGDTVVTPISASLVPNAKDCYANDSDPYLLFATKTSYFTVDNEIAEPIQIEGKIYTTFHNKLIIYKHIKIKIPVVKSIKI